MNIARESEMGSRPKSYRDLIVWQRSQFIIACELGFVPESSRSEIPGLIDEVSRMLNALRRSLSS